MKDADRYTSLVVCFMALQVESYTLNNLEKGRIVKEIVEVDVDKQTKVNPCTIA